MNKTLPIFTIAALSASALVAQTEVVLPASLDKFWGQGSSSMLGQNSSRTQLISANPFAIGTTITSLGLRPTASTTDRASFTADIEIRVSSGPNAPGSLDSTFANNVGNDEVVVFPQQTITVPDMPANRSTGRYLEIPFTTPFVFGTNGNTNLVVEVLVYSRSSGASWSTDRVFGGASGRAGTAGIGCGTATIGSSSTNTSGSSYVSGETVDVTISGANANSIALLVPSVDMKEFVPGLLLPFDLSMVGLGAGCDLLVSPQLGLYTYLTDATGGATFTLPIPAAFTGQSLGFQWAYLVPATTSNPLGLETTASRVVTIGPRVAVPDVQYVWDLFDVNSTTGTATTDSCPVHKLTVF